MKLFIHLEMLLLFMYLMEQKLDNCTPEIHCTASLSLLKFSA